ncbi:FMN-binding negative transcriptional regulator [Aquibium sp. LZ166]|uniref:FMN-binding negative transcriptional regulator n=1 Tax=Aquibium pacificus TaxID=3153579 RepID=A0ABV3SU30_9HYPH
MYQPPHFRETRLDVLHGLIRSEPLGLLVINGPEGPVANPLPFLLDADGSSNGTLRAHCARANPVWREIQASPEVPVLVVFQGPQAYVTPSWYATKKETGKVVPTWNYVIVQARGRAEIFEDADWLSGQIRNLTERHEATREKPWAVDDAPPEFVAAQVRGIVGIRIEIASLEGKWKMSQNRPAEDRARVAAGYDDAIRPDMASLVRRLGAERG